LAAEGDPFMFIIKLIRLLLGLFLFSLGIVMTVNARLGLAPWDVLHQGISHQTILTMGQASIGVGLIIIVLNFAFKEKIGIGTILNMVVIGLFIDFLMLNKLLPEPAGLPAKLALLFGGMVVISIASFLYIGAGLGAGPRDGLMVALHRKSGKSLRFTRNFIEITALIIGFFLGGTVGVGTVVLSLGQGFVIQFIFKLCKFDVKTVKHNYIDDNIRNALGKGRRKTVEKRRKGQTAENSEDIN
jgi:uncharacterized membrane protein YczE